MIRKNRKPEVNEELEVFIKLPYYGKIRNFFIDLIKQNRNYILENFLLGVFGNIKKTCKDRELLTFNLTPENFDETLNKLEEKDVIAGKATLLTRDKEEYDSYFGRTYLSFQNFNGKKLLLIKRSKRKGLFLSKDNLVKAELYVWRRPLDTIDDIETLLKLA